MKDRRQVNHQGGLNRYDTIGVYNWRVGLEIGASRSVDVEVRSPGSDLDYGGFS
jgi:hypothetical protein